MLAARPVTETVVPEILNDPAPPTALPLPYDDAPPLGALNVIVAVVEPVAVAETLVGGFGVVYCVPRDQAVPEPIELIGVRVKPPYCVFAARPLRVYEVPVIPDTVPYPPAESVNDVAPVPEFQLKMIEDAVHPLITKPVTAPGINVCAPTAFEFVLPFPFTAASVNGPYVPPPARPVRLYEVEAEPIPLTVPKPEPDKVYDV